MFKEMTEDMLALDIRILKRQGSLAKSSRFSFAIKSGAAKIAVGNCDRTPSGQPEYEGRTNWHVDLTEEAGRLLCQSEGSSVNLVFPTYVDAAHQTRALPKKRHYSSAGGYRVVDQQVQLTGTPCALGGHRLWWRCPCCEGRVAILYLRLMAGPETDNTTEEGKNGGTTNHWWGHGFFACRKCLELVYASQYQSAGDRSHDRVNDIRIELGATYSQLMNGTRFFDKPKGMHYKKFFRLLQEMWWRDEVFMAQIHQQFARYDMLIEMERRVREKKQRASLERQVRLSAKRPSQRRTRLPKSQRAGSSNNNAELAPTSAGSKRKPCKIARDYWQKYAPILADGSATTACLSAHQNPQQGKTPKRKKRPSKQRRLRQQTPNSFGLTRKTQALSVAMPKIRVSYFKSHAQQFKTELLKKQERIREQNRNSD